VPPPQAHIYIATPSKKYLPYGGGLEGLAIYGGAWGGVGGPTTGSYIFNAGAPAASKTNAAKA